MTFYSQFKDENGNKYGSFEVFHVDARRAKELNKLDGENQWRIGWYWWACFPGCLPDSDAIGPFPTDQEAYNDAQEGQ